MPLPQPIVVGGTYDWFLNPATINTETAPGVFGPWNITGAAVTITFMYFPNGINAPSNPGISFSATITTGTNGQAHYINSTSLFNIAGQWGYSWKVVQSGTVLESNIFSFMVNPSGAATAGS
jgi:hypothetical protein